MKRALWIILGTAGVAVGGTLAFLAYLGMFADLEVETREMGPYTIVYESFVGPYQETGRIFDRLYGALRADGIQTTDGIGIYYDDPREVPKDRLRSDCGVVIRPEDQALVAALQDRYRSMHLPRRRGLVATFPVRGSLSYMLGPMKGYPALQRAAERRGLELDTPYEYYAMEEKRIYFVAPIREAELPSSEAQDEPGL